MAWFVPGRIEVFGKHTDYAGGQSLLVAAAQGVRAAAHPPSGFDLAPGQVRARSTAVGGAADLTAGVAPALPPGHWGHYVQAVIDRLNSNFGPLLPAVVEVDSTLPLASGMSSSSALVCAVALALADQNGLWTQDRWHNNIHNFVDLAAYLATIENGLDFRGLPGAKGVGTFGGSQDHVAMLNCGGAEIGVFRFFPTAAQGALPMPTDYTFVVAVSGVLAEKTGGALEAYNNAALQVRRLVELWNEQEGSSHVSLSQILSDEDDEGSPVAPQNGLQTGHATPSNRRRLLALAAADPLLRSRLTAYLVEMEEAIPAAIQALEVGDVEAFGAAADLSHRNADQNLGNQIAETNVLQALARELGAPAASGFGAGFGGSVWALVRRPEAQRFAQDWLAQYLRRFPQHAGRASTLVTPASPAARRVA